MCIRDRSKPMPNAGGFKHNYQGLHMVDNLEQNASQKKGMNLTLAVREGILKHTKRDMLVKIRNYEKDKIENIEERVDYGTVSYTHLDVYKRQVLSPETQRWWRKVQQMDYISIPQG